MSTPPHTPKPTPSELRKFGLIMAGFIAVLFGLLLPWLLNAEPWPRWPWLLAAAFLALAVVYPRALHYPYKGWMVFGHAAGWVNTRIILGILFFLIFLPFGLVMRLFGRDPMFRRPQPEAASYRVASRQRDATHFEQPF